MRLQERKNSRSRFFNQPEAEMEAVVRYHLHRLIARSDDVRAEGRNSITV